MVTMKCFRGKNETLSHPELCLSRLESNGGRGVCGSGHQLPLLTVEVPQVLKANQIQFFKKK